MLLINWWSSKSFIFIFCMSAQSFLDATNFRTLYNPKCELTVKQEPTIGTIREKERKGKPKNVITWQNENSFDTIDREAAYVKRAFAYYCHCYVNNWIIKRFCFVRLMSIWPPVRPFFNSLALTSFVRHIYLIHYLSRVWIWLLAMWSYLIFIRGRGAATMLINDWIHNGLSFVGQSTAFCLTKSTCK